MKLTVAPILLSEDEALSLVEAAISKSQAEEVFVSVQASSSSLSRFSENQISQNIAKTQYRITISSYFGKRSASASTTELDVEAIASTIQRSEELARIAPEDPEWVPLLEAQIYEPRTAAFDEFTATLSPIKRGELVLKACALSEKAGVNGSGTLSTDTSVEAIGNSSGVRAFSQKTQADFSFTARIEDGSSWSQRTAFSVEKLPIEEIAQQIIERSLASRNRSEISPGVYPVIIDSAAFADLLNWTIWNMDARAADEGRSFMSRTDETGKPAGNRIGEQMFSPLVQIQRDSSHPLLQGHPFFSDGMPNNYLTVIEDGIPKTLSYSRYWAAQQGKESKGILYPIVMTGSHRSLADLIAETERGILMSRAWYVRYVNPRTLEVTGMTRDGTFWIEEGAIAYPIKNMRFNQVLPDMLRDIDAVSSVNRLGSSVVPGVRVRSFNFTSVTDSI